MSYKDYNDSRYVFLIGNGINQLKITKHGWNSIMNELSKKVSIKYINSYPLPSYFELLTVSNNNMTSKYLKDLFIQELKDLQPNHYHQEIYEFCDKHKINILTSNFDKAFEKANKLTEGADRLLTKGFTPHYPWQRYYKKNDENSIKLYHINGDLKYKSSIKLSVLDYSSNIVRFNNKFNVHDKKSKFYNDHTWLNELFEKELVIIGLKLGEEELFFRNLLVERKKYLDKLNKNTQGYYLYCEKDFKDDKELFKRFELFFTSVGIEMIKHNEYIDIYK